MKYYSKFSGTSECIGQLPNIQVLNYQESKFCVQHWPSYLQDEQDDELLPFSHTQVKVTRIQLFLPQTNLPSPI